MPDISDLRQRQALPLRAKVLMSQNRIREWYDHWNGDVYVSFSGGKDSTVLSHLVHDIYPNVPLVFSNTGLEYPEIQSFARKMGAEFVRPKMRFDEVISKYGYPIISKEVATSVEEARAHTDGHNAWIRRNEFTGTRVNPKTGELCPFQKTKYLPLVRDLQFKISSKCCDMMKKAPMKAYQRKSKRYPFIGTQTNESRIREFSWLKHGCNSFEEKKTSQPMSFWREQDVLQYIKDEGLEIASIYGEIVSTDKDGFGYDALPGCDFNLKCTGCQRTGCIFCGFGAHLDGRFIRLAKTHPKQYEYCMRGGQWVDNPNYDPSLPEYTKDWKHWNPKKIWVPSKEGLGIKKVFDDCNQIYGKDFIRYD